MTLIIKQVRNRLRSCTIYLSSRIHGTFYTHPLIRQDLLPVVQLWLGDFLAGMYYFLTISQGPAVT